MVSSMAIGHEDHHYFLSRKRMKVSDFECQHFVSNISKGIYADVTSSMQPNAEDCSPNGYYFFVPSLIIFIMGFAIAITD